jgi:hypothetical protein
MAGGEWTVVGRGCCVVWGGGRRHWSAAGCRSLLVLCRWWWGLSFVGGRSLFVAGVVGRGAHRIWAVGGSRGWGLLVLWGVFVWG